MTTEQSFEAANKITLIPVETRSRTKMFRVDRAGKPLGFIEKKPHDRFTTTPWQAFLGIGEGTRYLSYHYGSDAKQRCINDMVQATAGVFVGTEIVK